jgi:hypothetical protein
LPGLNAGITGSDAASGAVVGSRASLALAMPRHFGSVPERSAVPRIVVLRKTPDDVPQFVKQYRDLRFWSVPVVTRNRQHEVTSRPHERSPWVQLHNARSTIEERPVAIQLDDRVSASILSGPSGPWVFEKLPARTVFHAVDVRSSSHLQLEVQRPEYFGGVRIGFLEPCGARISRLPDLKNLLARAIVSPRLPRADNSSTTQSSLFGVRSE